ncbi:MAG: hypothetical protein J3K34DRAFT_443608 [Monoraphidium minutum]|nr:MAG: hypothetical protein J3K34DRAFT_443608 [Monoraphidium minutum]
MCVCVCVCAGISSGFRQCIVQPAQASGGASKTARRRRSQQPEQHAPVARAGRRRLLLLLLRERKLLVLRERVERRLLLKRLLRLLCLAALAAPLRHRHGVARRQRAEHVARDDLGRGCVPRADDVLRGVQPLGAVGGVVPPNAGAVHGVADERRAVGDGRAAAARRRLRRGLLLDSGRLLLNDRLLDYGLRLGVLRGGLRHGGLGVIVAVGGVALLRGRARGRAHRGCLAGEERVHVGGRRAAARRDVGHRRPVKRGRAGRDGQRRRRDVLGCEAPRQAVGRQRRRRALRGRV